MNVRLLTINDYDKLREIHNRFYANEFVFPAFEQFACSFIIENEAGTIITGGGIRTIPELVLITDQDQKVLDRKQALLESLQVSEYFCNKTGFSGLLAFVQNDKWRDRLIRTGFQYSKSTVLSLEF